MVLAKPGDTSTVVVVDGETFRVFDLATGDFVTPEFGAVTAEQQANEDARGADGEDDDEEAAEGEEKQAKSSDGKKVCD